MYSAVCTILLMLVAPGFAQDRGGKPTRIGRDKKVIESGWDQPNPRFMHDNAKGMDSLGFDGVVFHVEPLVDGQPVNFSLRAWGTQTFEYSQFVEEVELLRSCRFKRLTDNFLRFNVCPGDVDWYSDEEFGVVLHNARVAARVARESSSKGIMFDVEMYCAPLFTYRKQPFADRRSFAEYESIVRQRGQEFIRSINAEYPDIVILLTAGYAVTQFGANDLADARYGLLRAFLDGMFEAADERTVVVDANEFSYGYRRHSDFRTGYARIRQAVLERSTVPHEVFRRFQVGFGLWLDKSSPHYGWNTYDFERNYFTPSEFAYSLFSALSVTDRYVWVHSEIPRWWTNQRLPAAYRKALRRARSMTLINDAAIPSREILGDQVRARKMPGYDDRSTFGPLEAEWRFVRDLPRVWSFRRDPHRIGRAKGWFAPELPSSRGWREVEIGRFWDEHSGPHIGDAWYRLVWESPDFRLEGKTVALWFGAVDETAHVWVNGTLVGVHDVGPAGWDKPFSVDITGVLRPGQRNTIAVLVGNSQLAGGIWKSVKLAVRRN